MPCPNSGRPLCDVSEYDEDCDFRRSCKLIGAPKRPLRYQGFVIPNKGVNHMVPHKELLQELHEIARTGASVQSVMEQIAKRLHEKMTRYNWVGFYLVDPADAGYLIVGPFAGSFTPNARIPLNRGLCGAAATSGQTVVVQDVSKDPRYLSGSSIVKSEIVVPIFVKKKLAAELDIESYFADSFPKAEQEFVEACATVVADYLGAVS